jgi:parvulin-like peptidyl-prolyl isomerase
MLKSFLSFIAFILAGLQGVAAQSYVMSGIEKTDKDQMQYEVLGKVDGRYWIYKNNEGIATIAQYNDQMQLVQQNDLVFLPKKYFIIFMINDYRNFTKRTYFYKFRFKLFVFTYVYFG